MTNQNSITVGAAAMSTTRTGYGSTPSEIGGDGVIIARVKRVLLDNSDIEFFNRMGGWKALGSVEFIPFINFNDPNAIPSVARPLNSNITKYPLENEIVLIKTYVSKEAQNNIDNYKPEYYYYDIVSAFNAPEHNAVPDSSFFKNTNNASKPVTGIYQQAGDIKRIVKAPGDITIEGRRGTTIRLGSNTPGFNTPWVASSPKPIFIISNNQAKVSTEATFENINSDGSSVYMTSGHNIGFIPASSNFDSYNVTVNADVKQNYVVTDIKTTSNTDQSMAQADNVPPKPEPSEAPVATPVTSSLTSDEELDMIELPESENLEEVEFEYEEVPVSLGKYLESTFVEPLNTNSTATNASVNSGATVAGKKYSTSGASLQAQVNGFVSLNPGAENKLRAIAIKYNLVYDDMMRVIANESKGQFEKAKLWRKKLPNGKVDLKNTNVDGSYKLAATGLIQFTSQTNDIIKTKGYNSIDQIPENVDKQIELVDAYFNANRSKLVKTSGTGKTDIYAIYATIFYPAIVSGGAINRPDSFVLGSEKSPKRARDVGEQNPSINKGDVITVGDFKRFIDRKFK